MHVCKGQHDCCQRIPNAPIASTTRAVAPLLLAPLRCSAQCMGLWYADPPWHGTASTMEIPLLLGQYQASLSLYALKRLGVMHKHKRRKRTYFSINLSLKFLISIPKSFISFLIKFESHAQNKSRYRLYRRSKTIFIALQNLLVT